MNRPDGYPGLVRAYGLKFAEAPREMDRNLLYQAVAQGSIDVAAGDSTDGRIAALDLVLAMTAAGLRRTRLPSSAGANRDVAPPSRGPYRSISSPVRSPPSTMRV